jgi:hypothetical protein
MTSGVFPPEVIAAAQMSMQATGIPACISLSQWALESAWGAHNSGKNNCFGIKAVPGQACTARVTREVVGGKVVVITANFADYDSLEDAFTQHAKLLATKSPYAAARKLLPDALAFGKEMSKHYATDPAYWAKLLSIINAHHLLDFDKPRSPSVAAAAPDGPAVVTSYLCAACGRSDAEARAKGCAYPNGVAPAGSPPCPMEAVITSAQVAAKPIASPKLGPGLAPKAPPSTGFWAHLVAWIHGRPA